MDETNTDTTSGTEGASAPEETTEVASQNEGVTPPPILIKFKSVGKMLLYFALVLFVGMGLGWPTVAVVVDTDSYDSRDTELVELRDKALEYKDLTEDKRTLLKHNIPMRMLVFHLPRNGGTYNEGNREPIKKAIEAAIKGEMDLNSTLKASSDTAGKVILFIIFIQLLIFAIATHYSVITGKLRSEEKHRKRHEEMQDLSRRLSHVASHIAKHSSSILLTIGIGGTFLGLLMGLNNSVSSGSTGFNVVALLHGLKISFTSTLAGILLGILARIIQQAYAGPSESIESLVEKIDQLDRTMKEEIYQHVLDATKGYIEGNTAGIQTCSQDLKFCMSELKEFMDELKLVVMAVSVIKTDLTTASSKLGSIANNLSEASDSINEAHSDLISVPNALIEIRRLVEDLLVKLGSTANLQERCNKIIETTNDLLKENPSGRLDSLTDSISLLCDYLKQLHEQMDSKA